MAIDDPDTSAIGNCSCGGPASELMVLTIALLIWLMSNPYAAIVEMFWNRRDLIMDA